MIFARSYVTFKRNPCEHSPNMLIDENYCGVQSSLCSALSGISLRALSDLNQVRGGGHSMVPGFSSTKGIQISMSNFNDIRYDETTKTVDVGAGCLWDEVYSYMSELNRNVVGGFAAEGVGIGGYLLGGGYSLKSNQFGLGVDNIAKFELVLPNGEPMTVAEDDEKHADLFQALRVCRNAF